MRLPRTALATRTGVVAAALAVGVGGWVVVASAGPASAHASLVRSSPADRSSVATAPKTVSLTFDENVRMPSVILVTDAQGASAARGKPSVIDNIARIRVRVATSGDYTVVYRVVSADGHPVSGRLRFTVGAGGSGGTTDASSDHTATAGHQDESSGSATRVIGMVAALALLGGIGLLTVRRWAPNLWSSR